MLECSCCCGIFGIAIYNGNAVTDDNFDVYLNGSLIGSIDNSVNDFTGRIFTENETDFVAAKFGPQHPNVFQASVNLDLALLITGSNTLRIVDTAVHGSGNFGYVKVGLWALDETTVGYYDLHGTPMLDTTYGAGLGTLGGFQDFPFTY